MAEEFKALILAKDFVEGRNGRIEPQQGTVLRMQGGLHFQQETGATLAVAAGISPDFPDQTVPASQSMADWLEAQENCGKVWVLKTGMWDSEGELEAYLAKPATKRAIISARWHLWRVRVIVLVRYGWKVYRTIEWVAVPEDKISWREMCLEPLKYAKIFIPRKWHTSAMQVVRRVIKRPSW